MENKTENLLEILKQNNIKIISDINNFNEIIDINKFKLNINDIKNKKDVVIFFDSQSYNSNIFTDNIIEFVSNFKNLKFKTFSTMFYLNNNNIQKESLFFNSFKKSIINQLEKTDVYYCNDLNVFKEIFANFYDNKEKIKTTVLSFKYNKNESSAFIDYESLNVLNIRNISKVFLNLSNLNK